MVANPMFVPNPISAVFRKYSRGYKPNVRSQCDLQYVVCKSLGTNHIFVSYMISALFRMSINGCKLYVRTQTDFCIISHVNQWLQTLCSFPMRFLQYFICKAEVTNPMFVPNAMFVVFLMSSNGYKPHVRSKCMCCNILHVNQLL